MKYYENTNYPEIYKSTYWGNFSKNEITKNMTPQEIFDNRNKFIDEFNIKKNVKTSLRVIEREIKDLNLNGKISDHVEAYKCHNNSYCIVSSPYTDSYDNEYQKEGWIKIYSLYNNHASTYIKKIEIKQKQIYNYI